MIFDEQIARKPNLYPWTDKFIKTAHDGFWTHREFNFQSDAHDFKVNLTEQEKSIVVKALATIAQLEISLKKFWGNLGNNCPHPSLYDLGYVLSNQEVIHGDAYERLLEVLGIEEIFEEILQLDIIKGRVNYLRKHLNKFHSDNKKQFVYSLILFSLFIENISLFSQFYTISWFGKEKNYLKNTNKQVEYTSREENLHAEIGIKLINVIRDEFPEFFDDDLESKIIKEASQAVEYECAIIDWILDGYNHETLNSNVLRNFIKNRMNESLVKIGFPKIFEIENDLIKKAAWFDEQILGNNATDFFHSRPVEYSKNDKSFAEEDLF